MKKTYLYIFLMLIELSVFSQKKKKSDQGPMDVTQMSEDQALKAESTFIEAEKQLILENYDKAHELFLVALKLNPTNAAIHFKIAEVLVKMGETSEALAYAKKAIEFDNTNKYYYILAAEIYKSLGNYSAAAREFQYMIDNIPGTESYLFDLAIIYQFQGSYDKALEIYNRAEEIYGINEFVLREKQKIYIREKDYQSLIEDWDELIKANPGDSRYVIELCEFLINQEMLKEAGERLDKLLVDQPHNLEARLLLSKVALKEGNTQEALQLAEEVLSNTSFDYRSKLQLINSFLDVVITTEEFELVKDLTLSLAHQYPGQYEVQAYAGDVMYRLEFKDEARKYYLNALRISPSNYGVWQNVLNIEAELNQYDSVIAHAEEALEYFPNQAVLYYFAGTGHLINKNYKKSVQMLETGKKYAADPNLLTVFYGQLGDAYNSMKQHDKSDQSYEKALENNPNNDHVLNNYSYFLSLRNKDLDKALRMSTRLVEIHPDNPTYLDTHGWVLYTMKKYAEALKYLEKAVSMEDDSTVIEHYGDVLFQLGRIDEAIEQWERASKLDGASENIQRKIADRKLYE